MERGRVDLDCGQAAQSDLNSRLAEQMIPNKYQGPTYPLKSDEFRHALHVGLGRAVIHANSYGLATFAADVLDAALDCKVYDPQCEGYPADWLARLCETAGVVPQFLNAPVPDDSRSIELRCSILKELAQSGHANARQVLYSYCSRSAHTADVFACDDIVNLDGETGLRFVARRLGELLEEDAEFWVDDSPLWTFDSTRSDGEALVILSQAATADRLIRRYLEALEKPARPNSSAPERRREVPDVLVSVRNSTNSLYWLGHWAKELEEYDLQPFLELALAHHSNWVRENALRCIAGARRLSFQPSLTALLSHEAPGVRCFAAKAVARHSSPLIRAAALEVPPKDPETALTALQSCVVSEDAAAIWDSITSLEQTSEPHDVVYPLVQILKSNPSLGPSSLALFAYLESPCTNCRVNAVEVLFRHGQVPEWLVTEGADDSTQEIRNLCMTSP